MRYVDHPCRRTRRLTCRSLAILPLLILAAASTAASGQSAQPKYVILMIGDGMGFEQLRAASLYAYGREGALAMQQMPIRSEVRTHPAEGRQAVTDSAAAATALATGRKASRGVISLRIPGDGKPLETALEYHSNRGWSTGLVTTTYITHATPAGFGAHVERREMLTEIAQDYLTESRPNLLFGGVRGRNRKTKQIEGMSRKAAEAAGYAVVADRADLAAATADRPERLSGQFKTGHMPYEYDQADGKTRAYERIPRLSEMTRAALDILQDDPEGLFLMVEGGRIDHAGHDNQLEKMIFETLEFDRAVREVLRWAEGRDDVLVLVTADHETGGLDVRTGRGIGRFPSVTWSSAGHTGVNVPLFAQGPGAEQIGGAIDNTDVFWLITGRAHRRPVSPMGKLSRKCLRPPPGAASLRAEQQGRPFGQAKLTASAM